MAQSGYTPILIYASGSTGNTPSASNLTSSASGAELALNYFDGKLFYKDASGNVQVLASKAGNINVSSISFGTTGLTPNTATTGAVTVAGTLITSNGGTGLSSYTAGDLPYYASGTALSKLGIGTNGQILTSSGSAPQWSTLSGVAVTTFSAGTTGLTPSSATSGAVTLGGTLATTNGGTGLTSFTANQVFYASSTSAFAQSTNLQFSGTDLTVYGITVGRGAGAVSTNTAVGASALTTNSTGAQDVAVGLNALYYNTSGSYNSATGVSALQSNTTGGSNTAFGNSALFSNTTASNNTAVGYQAGYSNTTGAGLTFVGSGTGFANTTGTDNVAVGSGYSNGFTFYTNTTGSFNSVFGGAALRFNTTGSYNTAIGQSALLSNTTASNNTAVGYQALYSQDAGGSYNTALGMQAGYSATQGSNTFIGYQAGYSNTGYFNTIVGVNGAGNLMTTGHSNTILGGYNGNQGGLDIRTASNYIVLSDGDGNPRGIFDNNGSLAVGGTLFGGRITSTFPNSVYGIVANCTSTTGTTYYHRFLYNLTETGAITSTGTITVYATTSDYRLKTVVGPVSGSGERLDALEPIEYEWKSDGARTRGFLAHKFQEVYAGSVNGTKDAVDAEGKPVYQSMQAGSAEVIADLVAEIQSLRKRLADAGIA